MASPQVAARLTARQRLLGIAQVLSAEELDVLLAVAEGLMTGRQVYGPLDPAKDRRDFVNETLEEVRDALVYIGAELVRVRHA